jgi:Uma2 family endonuclease
MSTVSAALPQAIADRVEVTPEELLSLPDSGHYELIDGELKERNASVLSSLVAGRIIRRVGDHAEANRLGSVLPPDCGYRCFPWKSRRVRHADVSFIHADRLTEEVLSEGHSPIPPDLAVEVISPNDLAADLNLKIEEYLRAGVKLVWVVDPDVRTVDVYRRDGTTQRLHENDRLSGEDVVVGFERTVAAFFPGVSQKAAENAGGIEASHAGSA